MVRNNKRRAFTIVELVIVIAVIAILAAVMIPTFGGIIKKANISADTQMATAINTQIKMYLAEGKTIETEADLKNALTSDANFTEQLNPKSAKHGYHFWYIPETQEVKLLSNDEVLKAEKIDDFSNGETPVITFAESAPRSFANGYYFLDMAAEDSDNEIAAFFAVLENMSQDADAYKGALITLEGLKNSPKNDNQALAAELYARITATAVITDKGAFINTTEKNITFIYIPENRTGNENYYLSHTVNHATDAEVTDLLKLVNVAENSVIEIPAGVKVGEGTLAPFGAIVVLVDVENDDVTNLSDVFAAGAVSANAIVQINGTSYTVDGHEVKAVGSENVVETLTYLNPVTQFEAAADTQGNNLISITVTNNDGTTETSNYIALDKIMNVDSPIQLVLNAKNFVGTEGVNSPVYEDVIWSVKENVNGVSIDPETGKVEFTSDFTADTITFVASARAVNEGTVTSEFTVKVLRLFSTEIGFVKGGTGKATLTNKFENGEFIPTVLENNSLFVGIYANEDGAITTEAKFAAPTNFIYAYKNNTITLDDGQNHYETLGIVKEEITASITVNKQTYFEFDDNQYLTFKNIATLNGGTTTQYVVVTVSDGASTFSGNVAFTLNDNTNSPVTDTFPIYTEDSSYVYKVGNDSATALPLEELFAMKQTNTGDLSNHYLFVFAENVEQRDDYYWSPVKEYPLTELSTIDFSDAAYTVGAKYWLMIGEKEVLNGVVGVSTNGTVTNKVRVEVVAGENITAEMDIFHLLEDGSVAQKAATKNLVLHDNLVVKGESTKPALTLTNGASIYGNYFTIDAKKFRDTAGKNDGGYYMISMGANSQINNLILDGPTYPTFATPNDGSTYFCFGVLANGAGIQINDSYLFGFLSPVRVHSTNMVINNTTLEGGTWSNLWLNSAGTITLNNVTTVQNHLTGYAPDFGTDAEKASRVLGMGIYVNDDLAGKEITIKLKGVAQYNWLPETSDKDFGGNIDLARKVVFKTTDGERVYDKAFFHPVGEMDYVNAAIVYQCLDVTKVERYGSYHLEDEDCTNLTTYFCGHTKVTGWHKDATLTNACGSISSIAGVKNMPKIVVDFEDNIVNGKKVSYNESGFEDKDFRVEYKELSNSLKHAIDDKLEDKLGALGALGGATLEYLKPRFGIDVFAAAPLHDESCTVCKEDFSKLSTVRTNFTSVVTYADVDKLS